MTKFYVNEREISPPLDISSLDKVLKHIEDVHLPPDSVVRQVQVDGIPLVPDDLPEAGPEILQQLETREKIEVYTGTMPEIARESIAEAIAYLDRIETATPELASSFQVSPGPGSFESLRQLYEGFYWLNLLMDKLETGFHVTFDDVLVENIPARDHHQKFISILKQLIDSHERGDFAMIADLLEYEILPLVPVWKEMFRIIEKKAGVAS
jgi:hypothetical protein